ncbi:YHYH domain-containing protein [Sporosarcina sp. FSL K6-2383]|uniref:YHYH domain-containing protein n=1 Tax=Sporosarcina sp. FSL K6-2383 TaxID=2921556 RepID=UPI003159E901
MQKLFVTFSLILFTLSFFASNVSAHPGRTDGSGGHTCRTNCAKWGLNTGEYHYHNGGGSSSSATTTTSKPEPTYSQADVDEGKTSGQSKGYEDGYSRTNNNSITDIGNEGYKKGYVSGYEAGYNEGLKKIKEEDIVYGTTSGENDGKASLRKGENKEAPTNDSKSDDWNNAYKAAFIKSFDYEKTVQNAEKLGSDSGYSLAKLAVPADLSKDETVKKAFESHYKIGYEKRTKEENDKHLELGNKDGYALSSLAIASLDSRFVDSYKQGYEEGKSERKDEVLVEGHQSAFINMNYQETSDYDNQELMDWHKEGFESNEVAVQIKETAFENGHTNSEYVIPEEFKLNEESIALYDSLFQEGQELRNQENEKKMMVTAGIAVPVAGVAIGGLFLRKRKKKKLI